MGSKLASYFIEEKTGHPVADPSKATIWTVDRGSAAVPVLGMDMPGMLVRKVDESSRTLEMVGSDETVDRYREVISVSGWDLKNFRLNPVLLFGHDYWSPPIGKALKVWKDLGEYKALRFLLEFMPAEMNEFADQIYQMMLGKFLRTSSVGFLPFKWEDHEVEKGDDTAAWRTYQKQELLELSIVPVPANPSALSNAMTKGVIKEATFNRLRTEFKMPVERERITLAANLADTRPVDDADPVALECTKCHASFEVDGRDFEDADADLPELCPKCAAADALDVEPTAEDMKTVSGEGTVAPAAPDTETIEEPSALTQKTLVVRHFVSENAVLLLCSKEVLTQLATADGATVQWETLDHKSADAVAVYKLAHALALRAAFEALTPEQQTAIQTATPQGCMVDPFANDALAAGMLKHLAGVDVTVKSGAVLNKRNLARVKSIKQAAEEVLSEAEPSTEDEDSKTVAPVDPPAAPVAATVPAPDTRGADPGDPDEDDGVEVTTEAADSPAAPAPDSPEYELELELPDAGAKATTLAPVADDDPQGLTLEFDPADLRVAIRDSFTEALAILRGDVRTLARR